MNLPRNCETELVCRFEIDNKFVLGGRLKAKKPGDLPVPELDVARRSWPYQVGKSVRHRTLRCEKQELDVNSWLAEARTHIHDHHDTEIKTYTLLRMEPIRAVALTLILEALAEHCGADLLRLKGIVNIAESPDRPAVIHGVQHVFHAPAWLERWPSNDRRSRMVFITRRIPRRWVEVLLDAVDAEVAGVSAQG